MFGCRVKCCFWLENDSLKSNLVSHKTHDHKSHSLNSLRRLTPLGRNVLKTMEYSSSITEDRNIPWVISCRHGDAERLVNLHSNLANSETLSPTDFSMSVHNAIIGFYSIITQNKETNTAISGGENSFEAGLIEALALQRDKGGTVGYMYYDKPLPTIYNELVKKNSKEIYLVILLTDETSKILVDKTEDLIYLDYTNENNNKSKNNSSSIDIFMDFIKNVTKECEVSIPGGMFTFERGVKEA